MVVSADAITVELNGQAMLFEHNPLLKDGTTLIPLRSLLESLSANVKWEESTRTITVSRWNRTVRLGLEQELAYVQDKGQLPRQIKLSVPPQLIGEVTYVPLRFLSESFGAAVAWDVREQKVVVRTKSPIDAKAWEYRIIAGVTDQTAEAFGGLAEVKQKIVKQMDAVNQRYREKGFEGSPHFKIQSEDIYHFQGDGRKEALNKRHPQHEFIIIYDAFPDGGGGWYGGEAQSIYHAWPTGDFGSLFESAATDGLVHEFAHAIGNALDLYALNVDAGRNPISGEGYKAERSIMEYPYGETIWDNHTIATINKAGGYPVQEEERFLAEQFPDRMEIVTLDRDDRPLPHVMIRLYPVPWYSNEVLKEPIWSGWTNNEGVWQLEYNPFEPFFKGAPWGIRYANFLVEREFADGSKRYEWMPVDQVQLHRYRHPNQPYRLTVR
ncbi:copper amine oxidase N-terminal domain-containing protein [Paenibacillus mesophilus]|uniref:copper amine oxidase N-terminal domain-containing protein n=1 Tax=Paenibacillus mesophilus TaxID=2582849 RepID=UPI0013051E7B|nr:copper amine oxidase N-terminal domain-containing protein [Paenibacillus mesophilus]